MSETTTIDKLLPPESCDTKTINDLLPDEVLINIFKYLIWTDIWNVALTCKLWRELTDHSSLWCVSLNYYQVHSDPAKLDFLRTTNRKFHTIKIRGDLRNLEMDDIVLIQRLGPTVVKLIWIGNRCADITKFGQMLHCLPNVKHISVFNSTVDHYNDDLPDLRILESLKLSNCEGKILEMFLRAKLKRLTLELYSRTPVGLREFLMHRPNLHINLIVKQLNVEGLGELSTLNLRLRNFSAAVDAYGSVLCILQANMETLMELDLNGHLQDSTFELVFTKLLKLKSLKLRVFGVPKDIKFYERLDISHLNDLTLFDPPEPCEYFFMRLPHLKSLTLLSCRKEFLKLIFDKLFSLTSLFIDSDDQLTTDRIIIPSMTTLHIRTLSYKIDWDEFTKDNHQLTELIIDNVERKEFLNILDIECITENTSLRVLRIGKCFTASADMLMVIRCNSPLLEVLILGSENFSWLFGDR